MLPACNRLSSAIEKIAYCMAEDLPREPVPSVNSTMDALSLSQSGEIWFNGFH